MLVRFTDYINGLVCWARLATSLISDSPARINEYTSAQLASFDLSNLFPFADWLDKNSKTGEHNIDFVYHVYRQSPYNVNEKCLK